MQKPDLSQAGQAGAESPFEGATQLHECLTVEMLDAGMEAYYEWRDQADVPPDVAVGTLCHEIFKAMARTLQAQRMVLVHAPQ